jgi:hypothetical protein
MSSIQELENRESEICGFVRFNHENLVSCDGEFARFLTCWLSVLIEKAEMSNKVLKISPKDMRIHII